MRQYFTLLTCLFPLERIHDNYPKYILTRNDPIQKRNGIIHANLPEFMRDGMSAGLLSRR